MFISAHSPRLYPGNIFHNNDTHMEGWAGGKSEQYKRGGHGHPVSHGRYPNIDMERNRIFDTFVLESIHDTPEL